MKPMPIRQMRMAAKVMDLFMGDYLKDMSNDGKIKRANWTV
jgi:hypothetical protein